MTKKAHETDCIHYLNGCDRGKIDLVPCVGTNCGYFMDKETCLTKQEEEYFKTVDNPDVDPDAPDYSLHLDFNLLRSQKQGLLAILNDDNNKEAVELYNLEGIVTLIDSIQDQAVDKHGKPEKEVFYLNDDGVDLPDTEDEHSPQTVLDRDLRVYDRNHVVHLIDKAIAQTFDAYQHFLFNINQEHIRQIKPWGEHMTNHFLEKLAYYRSIKHADHNSPEVIVTWIQNMTHHNQDALIVYMRKYHSGKGGGYRSWEK